MPLPLTAALGHPLPREKLDFFKRSKLPLNRIKGLLGVRHGRSPVWLKRTASPHEEWSW